MSTSTRCEPATTWALVTTSSFPIGHDEPASAPPQPNAITLEVTAVVVRMPGVSTSGGIDAGAGAPGESPEKGLGNWLLRSEFSSCARKPGGRGAMVSSACSMAEPRIWVSSPVHGLCENVSPRYHEPARTPNTASTAPSTLSH